MVFKYSICCLSSHDPRTDPCQEHRYQNEDQSLYQVGSLIETKEMRTQQRCCLRIEARIEGRAAEQEIIEEEDIEDFDSQCHDQESQKELCKHIPLSDPVRSSVIERIKDYK